LKAGARIETARLVLRHWRAGDLVQFDQLYNIGRVTRYFVYRQTHEHLRRHVRYRVTGEKRQARQTLA
jgi:RimJ/RimL family protein N-acetyltransferase